MLDTILTLSFVFISSVLVLLNASRQGCFLFFLGFVIPLSTIKLEVGINISWYIIAPILSLLMIPFSSTRKTVGFHNRRFSILILYVIAITVVWMVLDYTVFMRYQIAEWYGLRNRQKINVATIRAHGMMLRNGRPTSGEVCGCVAPA